MIPRLEGAGLSFVGRDETGRRMEVRFQCKLFAFFFAESVGANKKALIFLD